MRLWKALKAMWLAFWMPTEQQVPQDVVNTDWYWRMKQQKEEWGFYE